MAEQVVNYKCPACQAPISFKPDAAKVVCEYCNTQFDVETIKKLFEEKEKIAALAKEKEDAKWQAAAESKEFSEEEVKNLRTFTCSACGAELVCDNNTMATECCYCGNPAMIPGRFSNMLKPNYIIPFKKTKDEAVAALKEFYNGKELLPDAFTQNNRIEDIQGMYVPFWLFDCSVEGNASYEATRSFTTKVGKTTTITTDYYNCFRAGSMDFTMVPVDGSVKMEDDFMESIEPFDYSEMVPFESTYMAGYLADKYDVEAEKAMARAEERMQGSVESILYHTVNGYACVDYAHESAMNRIGGSFSYAMVPVWILTTRFENNPYTFMMNGQTGKFIGRLPIDEAKRKSLYRKDFLIAFPVILGLILLGIYLLVEFG